MKNESILTSHDSIKNSRAQALNMICGSVKTEMNLPNKNCGEC